MNARLITISGAGGKEPAAFLVEADGRRMLLDCGEGPEPGVLPDFSAIGRVDAIVLSHAHKDHAGALRLRDRIGSPPIFATEPVMTRLPHGMAAHPVPIRGRTQVLGIDIETGADGHAPGGVWLRLDAGAGLLYMGDCSTESSVYCFDPPPAAATMIFDASYGDAEEMQSRQRAALADLAEQRGAMLLPVPPDGRAVEMAIFLQAAGFPVAIDAAVREVAIQLTQSARASARPASVPALERLVREARELDGDSPSSGVMLAHGASADVGVAAALVSRWRDQADPAIVLTGHVADGTTSRALLDGGRAQFQRWNVHPTFAQNVQLIERVGPRQLIPAFGDTHFLALWRDCLAPREVITSKVVEL
ncbi:MAG TPA: MBL fold metallo-hydrolase [Xanthobacteraceae bacterium]|jgi:Cft2 family RNA processing exonuclease|nr:MBL fold metallo-hydrolase [Xanthobacteraceae bacterium]